MLPHSHIHTIAGGIAMKTQEIIKALRETPSRSKRVLLDEAADRLEELQKENNTLISKMLEEGRTESGLTDE